MPYYIYTLADPRDLIIRYIGISTNPVRRYKQHISEAGSGSIAKESWLQGLTHLQIIPALTLIDETKTEHEARSRETFWIDYYRRKGAPLLNTQQRYAPHKLITEQYEQMALTQEEAENVITEITRCAAQGRFQDISIKHLAQLEYLISNYADNYTMGMTVHGLSPNKTAWKEARKRRTATLGIAYE